MDDVLIADNVDVFRIWYRTNNDIPINSILHRAISIASINIFQELITAYPVDIHGTESYGFILYTPLEISSLYLHCYADKYGRVKRIILLLCQHGAYTETLCHLSQAMRDDVNHDLIYPVRALIHLVRMKGIPKDIWRTLKTYLY